MRPPVSVSEEKWLINQNIFVKTKEWRLSEIKMGTLCREGKLIRLAAGPE